MQGVTEPFILQSASDPRHDVFLRATDGQEDQHETAEDETEDLEEADCRVGSVGMLLRSGGTGGHLGCCPGIRMRPVACLPF